MTNPDSSTTELETEVNNLLLDYAQAKGVSLLAATKDMYPLITEPLMSLIKHRVEAALDEAFKDYDAYLAARKKRREAIEAERQRIQQNPALKGEK